MVASDKKTDIQVDGGRREGAPLPPRSRSTIYGRLPQLLTKLDDRELLLVVAVAQRLANSRGTRFADRLGLVVEMDTDNPPRESSPGHGLDSNPRASSPAPRGSSSHDAITSNALASVPESPTDPQPTAAGWVHRTSGVMRTRRTPSPEPRLSTSSPAVSGRYRTPLHASGIHKIRGQGTPNTSQGRAARTLGDFFGFPVDVPPVPIELDAAAKRVRTFGLELFYFPPTALGLPETARSYSGAKYGALYSRSDEGHWALVDMTRPSSRKGGRYEHDALIGRTAARRTTRMGLSFFAAEDAIRQIQDQLRLQRFRAQLLSPGEWIFLANLLEIQFRDPTVTAREWVGYASRDRGPAVGGPLVEGTVPYNLHKKTETIRDVGFRFCITL